MITATTNKPESLPEKNQADNSPRWVFVHELKAMLDEFNDDDWVAINRVNNLNVGRGDNDMIATIDLRWTKVIWYDDEHDNDE